MSCAIRPPSEEARTHVGDFWPFLESIIKSSLARCWWKLGHNKLQQERRRRREWIGHETELTNSAQVHTAPALSDRWWACILLMRIIVSPRIQASVLIPVQSIWRPATCIGILDIFFLEKGKFSTSTVQPIFTAISAPKLIINNK
jgi:hypothetical protein